MSAQLAQLGRCARLARCALLALALAPACAARSPAAPSTVTPVPAPVSAPGTAPGTAAAGSELERRLAFYEAKVRSSPQHYPSMAQLAMVQLDLAKETGDPAWLARARAQVKRSMEIQPSFQAMKTAAAIASYSHHFAEALTLAQQARGVYPPDTALISLEVEAQLGLGELAAAERLVRSFPDIDFHAAFALALVAMAQRRFDGAAAFYEVAASRAADQQVPALRRFALVSAGGALLDGGNLDRAAYLLLQAEGVPPLRPVDGRRDRRLSIHLIEWIEAIGKPADALAGLEELLAERDDPELHRHAARLARSLVAARRLADPSIAERHFAAARAGYQRVLDAGEIYALEGYSLLLSEAGVEPALALELAQRNLEHKRDASAKAALQRAKAALQQAPAGPSSPPSAPPALR
jgi:hypothetical protein